MGMSKFVSEQSTGHDVKKIAVGLGGNLLEPARTHSSSNQDGMPPSTHAATIEKTSFHVRRNP
jgi:hypothetical protein